MKKPIKSPRKFKSVVKSRYLNKVYDLEEFLKIVPAAVKKITVWKKKHPFDAIAFTGTSGAALAYPLSLYLKIPLICIRKGDGNHYKADLEGCVNARKYIIVDDFIDTGSTVNKIINTIKQDSHTKAKPVGIYLYTDMSTYSSFKELPVIRANK